MERMKRTVEDINETENEEDHEPGVEMSMHALPENIVYYAIKIKEISKGSLYHFN